MKSNLNLQICDKKRPCEKCSGYGIFSETRERELTHCPICKSIHPEALGLTFMRENLTKENIFIYMKEHEWNWLYFGF